MQFSCAKIVIETKLLKMMLKMKKTNYISLDYKITYAPYVTKSLIEISFILVDFACFQT